MPGCAWWLVRAEGLEMMARSLQGGGGDPVPRYVMPDGSAPDYYHILQHMQKFHTPLIGNSYFYLRKSKETTNLCRIIPGGGQIFFHEFVDPSRYGISEGEIASALQENRGSKNNDGYYPVPAGIELKLRMQFSGE